MEAPPDHQRPRFAAVEHPKSHRLTFDFGHPVVQADAIAHIRSRQHAHQPGSQQFGVAQFDRVERQVLAELARQGREERSHPLDQHGRFSDQLPRQRRDLKDQGTRLGTESLEARHDELAGGDGGVEEMRIGHFPSPVLIAHHGIADQRGRLHDETEAVRHLRCIARILDRGDWRVECPI